MPVITFARKLVEEVWGGHLTEEEILKKQATPADDDTDALMNSSPADHLQRSASGNDNRIHTRHDDDEEEDEHMLFTTDQLEADASGGPSYHRRREYYHEGSAQASGARRRRASQKFMDALEDEEALQEEYRWGAHRLDGDEFYDAHESVQDSMPSLHTAVSSVSRARSVYGKKKRKKRGPNKKAAPKKASMRGNRQGCFTWQDRMVQLQDYKDIHGHLRVPTAKKGVY